MRTFQLQNALINVFSLRPSKLLRYPLLSKECCSSGQAEYSYFAAVFRLKVFVCIILKKKKNYYDILYGF